MSTFNVTKRLAKLGHPEVELVRGEGYHYFVFDSSRVDPTAPLSYTSESVYIPHFRSWPFERWVQEGVSFAEAFKAKLAAGREFAA